MALENESAIISSGLEKLESSYANKASLGIGASKCRLCIHFGFQILRRFDLLESRNGSATWRWRWP